MGRNRKWVLEDKLSEAVWRTILRGPRPPSVQWPKSRRNVSAVDDQAPKTKKGKGKGQESAKGAGKGSASAKNQNQSSVQPRSDSERKDRSLNPDEFVAAAQLRVG